MKNKIKEILNRIGDELYKWLDIYILRLLLIFVILCIFVFAIIIIASFTSGILKIILMLLLFSVLFSFF